MCKEKNKLKSKKSHILLKIFLILIVITLILNMAVFSAYVYKSNGNIAEATINIATDIVGKQDTIYTLFLGISDDTKVVLTDTIMLAGYSPENQRAFLLSIPRDTFIGKNTKNVSGYNKINSIYKKSPESLLNTVSDITGIQVSNYVVIKNKALREAVDAIGGVEFNIPINMNYDDKSQNLHIHLKAGQQLVNGQMAEHLLRFRHNNNGTSYPASYGDNDLGRMRTQREFLKEMASQIISIKNIPKIKDLASAVFENIQTNISIKTIFSYIPYVVEYNTENLKLAELPGESRLINEIWFYEYNKKQTNILTNELINYLEENI